MQASKFILGISLFLICVSTSHGQQRPPEIVPQLGEPTGAGVVSYFEFSTPEQRNFYWKNSVKKDGYILVDVQAAYMSIVSVDVGLINSWHNKPSSQVAKHLTKAHLGLKFLGRFNESANRATDFYEMAESRKTMLTTWRFVAAGGGMRIPIEFVNAKVLNNKATLVLGKAPNLNKVMWHLSWNDLVNSYDLYLEDELDAQGDPLKKPKDVITLAEKLVTN